MSTHWMACEAVAYHGHISPEQSCQDAKVIDLQETPVGSFGMAGEEVEQGGGQHADLENVF